MTRKKSAAPSVDSFDAFLQPSDVEQIYIVLSLAKQSHGNDLARGMQALQTAPADFARTAIDHQDKIAQRHYGIAILFGVIVVAMVYVMYQGFTTPGVGVLGVLLPAAMACFALWRMERSVHRGRQGNLLLLRLLDALEGQPFSYDAAQFAAFAARHPALVQATPDFPEPDQVALKHLAQLKCAEIGLRDQ